MKKKKLKIIGIILAVLLLLIIGSCVWYVEDYYHADAVAADALQSNDKVSVMKIENGYYFDGEGTSQVLIFYPGAKVEYTAYAPLMMQLAESGVDCFLLQMPCNLAFLGKNRASAVMDAYTYDEWYLGGHSLGGAMAAVYAADADHLSGLVLLGAYPTSPLPKNDFKLLSIYGSEDGVLNMNKWEEGKQYAPTETTCLCIEGGNHAFYGNYGEQSGDGEATITRDEQQEKTVDAIISWIK